MKDLKAGEASRTEILAWCLEHHFELVECDEGEDEDEEGEDEDEGIEEKLGRARVVEALKVVSITHQRTWYTWYQQQQAHTWSNLELLESGPAGRRPVPLDEEGGSGSEGEEEEGEVGEQVIHHDTNEDGDGDEESYRSRKR